MCKLTQSGCCSLQTGTKVIGILSLIAWVGIQKIILIIPTFRCIG